MSVRSVSEIMGEMLRRYKQRPSLQDKWRFLAGYDEHGYSDFFIYGPSFGIWQIKGELKNPYELVGAGARVAPRKIDNEIREVLEQGVPMPFGFLSPHPRMNDRAIVAAGVGRYQESMEELKSALPGRHSFAERELKQRLDELRRKFGLDAAYR
ncbi:MAG: hypothetical protein ABH852_03925 [Methanobacteriota archaeon]